MPRTLKAIAKDVLDRRVNTLPEELKYHFKGMLWLDNIHESFNHFVSGLDLCMSVMELTAYTKDRVLLAARREIYNLLPSWNRRNFRI